MTNRQTVMNRLKDDQPLATVEKARAILHEIGIFVIERWNDSGIPGIYSVRIAIIGTNIGTNGKGATEPLALASGYGEFMERLQNGLLFSSLHYKNKSTHFCCVKVPVSYFTKRALLLDAVLFGMKMRNENIADGIQNVSMIGLRPDIKKRRLAAWDGIFSLPEDDDSEILSAPFVGLLNGEKEYLPVQMLCAYGSHGMAAGNSYREAIIQGLSEIFERYAQKEIIDQRLCPPVIAMSLLAKKFPNIWKYVKFIEAHDELSVELRDCSLGVGLPVYCICISNKKTHRFSVTFGSHPNIGVALERLFTEVFQGRTLKDVSNRICSDTLPEPFNIKSLFKVSIGNYPMEFWGGTESYAVDDVLLDQNFNSNETAYEHYLSLCKRLGMCPYVRDVGYLGFPSVHIIIPGFSEVLCCNDFVLRHNEMTQRISKLLLSYDCICDQDKELIVEFLDFDCKIGLVGSGRPYCFLKSKGGDLPPAATVLRFIALIAWRLGKYDRARSYFDKIAKHPRTSHAEEYICMADICRLLEDGCSIAVAEKVLSRFYEHGVLERARHILDTNPSELIDTCEENEIKKLLSESAASLWNRSVVFKSRLLECCSC